MVFIVVHVYFSSVDSCYQSNRIDRTKYLTFQMNELHTTTTTTAKIVKRKNTERNFWGEMEKRGRDKMQF